MSETDAFEGWAIVEQLGHKRVAGYVRQVELAGVGMLRIDVPSTASREAVTQFISPSTLYAMTPTTEETARKVADWSYARPITYWEQRQLAAPATGEDESPDLDAIPFDDLGIEDDEEDLDRLAEREHRLKYGDAPFMEADRR